MKIIKNKKVEALKATLHTVGNNCQVENVC